MDASTLGPGRWRDIPPAYDVFHCEEESEQRYGLDVGGNMWLDWFPGRPGLVDGEEWVER